MRMPIKQQDYKGMGVGGRPGEEAGCNAQNNGFGAFWECPKRPRSGQMDFSGRRAYTFREIPA
jgi:hypothetical protein